MSDKFKEGDVVYHKATLKRGVISKKEDNGECFIKWQDDKQTCSRESELYTEQEHEDKYGPGIA